MKKKYNISEENLKKRVLNLGNRMLGKKQSNYQKIQQSNRMKKNNPMNNLENRKKISETKKKLYKEGKLKPYSHWKGIVGKENPSYIDGRSYTDYPIEFRRIRNNKTIHIRDNYTCQLCGDVLTNTKLGDSKHLTLHHIDYNKNNNNLNNLIALCNFCNTSVNKNREEWTNLFQEKLNGN